MSNLKTNLSKGVLSLTLSREADRNSLSSGVILALKKSFQAVSQNPRVRVVVLSGSGNFCAGADLKELKKNRTPSQRQDFFRSIAELIEAVHRCPVPVIAKVEGYALAGGCGLAAACDLVFASEDAVFGLPELHVGMAAMVVMAPIHRAIGRRALSELLFTAERISAARAVEIGLVTRVLAKDKLAGAVKEIAEKLSQHPPRAMQLAKEALLEVGEEEYFGALRRLADRSAIVSLGAEAVEGISAFQEKRKPDWRKAHS